MRRAAGLQDAIHDRLALGGADLGLDGPLERADDVARGDVVRISRERVSATRAALPLYEASLAQARDKLLEIRLGQLLTRRDRVEAHGTLAEVPCEIDHETHAVFAARRNLESGLWGNSEHFTRYYAPTKHETPMPLTYARAAVGSTNPAKLEAVHRALARLAPGCTVEGVDVPSGVGRQPFGDDETRGGASARALNALSVSGADLAFGLEGGVIFEGDVPWLVSWVAAIDREGRSGEASGLRMPLPAAAAARLRSGDELGDVIDALFDVHLSKQQAGAIGLLTEGFVSRTDAFADLVAMACAPLLRPDLY